MIVTKKHLSRRTVLRGIGATVALPLLDGMVPALTALSQTAARPVGRLGVVYVPNGVWMQLWTPKTDGSGFELTPTLEPLASFRDRLTVVTGLSSKEADPRPGEGAGDHARAAGAFLTAAHPNKTEGADLRAGISMDQIAAETLGQETQLGSLELALDSNELVGACDAGYSCAYSNTLSWRTATTPLPMESDPRAVFERLFGSSESTDPAERMARLREDRSVLDAVTDKLTRLQGELGTGDRSRLDEYLDAIRNVERRIRLAEEQSGRELPHVERPVGIPATFEAHAKLMFDLQVLAYQTDMTRVITFMMGREVSSRSFPEIGVPDAHHPLSHHQGDQEKIAKLIKVDAYHTEMLAYYLGRLQDTPDGDGTLLDSSAILYAGGISDGNNHSHHGLPVLLAGGGGGALSGGRHVRVEPDTPIANLYVTLLEMIGVPVQRFGDSTGRLDRLAVA